MPSAECAETAAGGSRRCIESAGMVLCRRGNESFSYRRREFDDHKKLLGIKIVFAGLVDHTQIILRFGAAIGKHFIKFPDFQVIAALVGSTHSEFFFSTRLGHDV